MTIITGCKDPDLDGIACMISYSELLNSQGVEAKAVYFGDIDYETKFVSDFTGHFPIIQKSDHYPPNSEFVLVDTANPDIIDPSIPLENVVRVFDHRQLVYMDKFPNSENRVELVGSCATLIAEEFQKCNVTPSKDTSIYLYSAIVFSTINFKNSVTTQRDIVAADWMLKLSGLDNSFVRQLFSAKSEISTNNLYSILSQDFSVKTISEYRIGIAQIEMIDIERMTGDLRDSLQQALARLKTEHSLNYIFFNGIDLLEGYSLFSVIDSESSVLFSQSLGIPGIESGHKHSDILMRKQIWPKVEVYLLSMDKK